MISRTLDRTTFLRIAWVVVGVCVLADAIRMSEPLRFSTLIESPLTLFYALIRALACVALPAIAGTWFIQREDFDANLRGLLLGMIAGTVIVGCSIAAPRNLFSWSPDAELFSVLPFVLGPLVIIVMGLTGSVSPSGRAPLLRRDSIVFLTLASLLLLATPFIGQLIGWCFNPVVANLYADSFTGYIMPIFYLSPHIVIAVELLWLCIWLPSFYTKRRVFVRGVAVLAVGTIAPTVFILAVGLPWEIAFALPIYGLGLLVYVGIWTLQ
jgi:hypothetical protein